jgi:hypothetical protein
MPISSNARHGDPQEQLTLRMMTIDEEAAAAALMRSTLRF